MRIKSGRIFKRQVILFVKISRRNSKFEWFDKEKSPWICQVNCAIFLRVCVCGCVYFSVCCLLTSIINKLPKVDSWPEKAFSCSNKLRRLYQTREFFFRFLFIIEASKWIKLWPQQTRDQTTKNVVAYKNHSEKNGYIQ